MVNLGHGFYGMRHTRNGQTVQLLGMIYCMCTGFQVQVSDDFELTHALESLHCVRMSHRYALQARRR